MTNCGTHKVGNVLFIGNSLTFYHNMPTTLQRMFDETGIEANIHQATEPGFSLSNHLNNQASLDKLSVQNWDYVILQEATVRVLIPEVKKYSFEPAVAEWNKLIEQNGAKTVLYQCFPISIYPETYCYSSIAINKEIISGKYCSEELLNSDREFEIIEASFNDISERIDCEIALVGKAFELCKKSCPSLNLFEAANDSHPSKLGAYLIACVFYKQLSGLEVQNVKFSAGLNESDATSIRKIVDSL